MAMIQGVLMEIFHIRTLYHAACASPVPPNPYNPNGDAVISEAGQSKYTTTLSNFVKSVTAGSLCLLWHFFLNFLLPRTIASNIYNLI